MLGVGFWTARSRILDAIDLVRKKVNSMKHDPLAHRVVQSDYMSEINTFQEFWDRLIEIEISPFG
jgi:hypothetical protein